MHLQNHRALPRLGRRAVSFSAVNSQRISVKTDSICSNTNEAYFYVFEVLLMLSNSVMLNIMHPGRLLPKDSKIYLSTDGVTELKGPGWRDPRKWYWQFMDPFDFAGCCRKEEKYDFWNHPEENAEAETEIARADVETGEAKSEGVIAAAGNARVASSEVETKKRPIWLGALYRGRK